MEEHGDHDLVRQCLEGDHQGFALLVEKYRKTIFNIVFKMLSDYDAAADVTQSVFVKAYEKLDLFNPRYKFFSWLYRIAINESLNFLKSRKQDATLDDATHVTANALDESYEREEKSRHVQDALMELEPQYRALILLRHFQNFSYSEISEITEVPEKTVKSRLFTARLQLREILLKKGTVL